MGLGFGVAGCGFSRAELVEAPKIESVAIPLLRGG